MIIGLSISGGQIYVYLFAFQSVDSFLFMPITVGSLFYNLLSLGYRYISHFLVSYSNSRSVRYTHMVITDIDCFGGFGDFRHSVLKRKIQLIVGLHMDRTIWIILC